MIAKRPVGFGDRRKKATPPVPSKGRDNKTLAALMAAGDSAARNELIENNQRLVMRQARRYARSDVPMEDLIGSGMLGLIHAVDKFDPDRGTELSTYAVPWISYFIEKHIMGNTTGMSVPEALHKLSRKVVKAERVLAQALGREPTRNELADYLQLSASEVASGQWVSLMKKEEPDDEGADPILSVECTDTAGPADQAEMQLAAEKLSACMRGLSPVDRSILSASFGLDRPEPGTHESIAAEHGLTARQVRYKIQKSLDLLRGSFLEEA